MSNHESNVSADSAAADARTARVFQYFLIGCVAALCVLVLLLVRQNRDLQAQIEAKKRLEQSTGTPSLAIGETVEPLRIVASGGVVSRTEFDDAQPATLILFTSEHCGYCQKAIPLWVSALRETRESLAGTKGPGVRVVGIVADAMDDASLKPIAPEIPTFRVPDGPTTWLRRVNATPSVVLLSPQGRVENFWIGEMSSGQAEEMRGAILEAAAR